MHSLSPYAQRRFPETDSVSVQATPFIPLGRSILSLSLCFVPDCCLLWFSLLTMSCGRTQERLDHLLEKCRQSHADGTLVYPKLFNDHFYEGLPVTVPCFLCTANVQTLSEIPVCHLLAISGKNFFTEQNNSIFESLSRWLCSVFLELKEGVPYTYCKACKENDLPRKKIADHPAEPSGAFIF